MVIGPAHLAIRSMAARWPAPSPNCSGPEPGSYRGSGDACAGTHPATAATQIPCTGSCFVNRKADCATRRRDDCIDGIQPVRRIPDRSHCHSGPHRPIWRDRRLTYAEMDSRISGIAHYLAAQGLGCHTERDALPDISRARITWVYTCATAINIWSR